MDEGYLQWYRDKGNGQLASNEVKANETMLGNWPLAQLPFSGIDDRNQKWMLLYSKYKVNATATYPVKS